MGGAGEAAGKLADALEELEAERRGYLRQNARGVLPDGECDEMIAALDGQRKAVRQQLEDRENANEKIAELEREKAEILAAVESAGWMTWTKESPEDRRMDYDYYRMRFAVDQDGNLKASGERLAHPAVRSEVEKKSLQLEHTGS